MFWKLFFILSPLMLLSSAFADPAPSSTASESHHNLYDDEKWFFFVSVGVVPQPQFDSGIQSNIDTGKSANGWAGDYGGVLEFPGVYYRITPRSMLGLIGNFIFEDYAANWRYNSSLSYQTFNISLSWMGFTGPQPGLGYFIRADIGPAQFIEVDQVPVGTGTTYYRTFYSGPMEQLGLGYGFQSSLHTRMLTYLSYFYEDVGAHYQQGLSVNIGLLM